MKKKGWSKIHSVFGFNNLALLVGLWFKLNPIMGGTTSLRNGRVRIKHGVCAIALSECHFLFCCVEDFWPAVDKPGCVAPKQEVIFMQCNGTINMLGYNVT